MTVTAELKITVGHLYPGLMSADGDRGNIGAIVRRCGWRNISVAVAELGLGDMVTPGTLDIIVVGGGSASQQRLVAADLYKVKGAGIRDAVAAGAAALAVGAGYELFGRFCQPAEGPELRGIELFDCWTIRADTRGHHGGHASGARADQEAGDLVVRWGGTLLAGFEKPSGNTYLGRTARPLGQVVRGHGNNGDGCEGCIIGSAVGTNLRGPCLPANPALADFLISAALIHRYGTAELWPLADDLEQAAHDAVQRAHPARRDGGLTRGLTRGLRRPAARGGRPRPWHSRRGVSVRSGARR
jgi:lipid II isoglutaminyl synthase (glutamine-hydrolysing)